MKAIAVFAGDAARGLVDDIGNAMNLQADTHTTFDSLEWGIEAIADKGQVRLLQSICR
jgi:hypothetical protein